MPGCTQADGRPYQVHNFIQDRAYGEQPLKVAFSNSLNISAVKTEMAVGVPQLVDFYRNMGLKPAQPQPDGTYPTTNPDTSYCPSLTLGGYPITLLQHATGLSVFANLGTYHQPESILSVADAKGNLLYRANPNHGARRALDPGVAFIVSSILADDNNRSLVFGRGTPLHLTDHLAAAKTGTSEGFQDGLTVGWTPHLVSAFWIGDRQGAADQGYRMTASNSDGVFVAAPAWHQFMEQALRGVPGTDWYTPPSDVVQAGGNNWFLLDANGKPINDITHLPGDPAPSSQGDSGAPADPGTGPVPIGGGQGGRGGGGIGLGGGGGGGILPPIGG
jgi:membrane peptidoglycan carboxypeptidase